MPIRIVRLGTARFLNEGLRLGTVRRPPRGVRKEQIGTFDFYDVWLPALAPSAPLVASAKAVTTPAQWQRFQKRYRAEMSRPDASRLLDLLASFSHTTSFSMGCYCEDESRCHRSVLRELLLERYAALV